MKLHSRLVISAAILLALTNTSRAADLEPLAVTNEDEAIDWKDCTYARAGGEIYVLTRANSDANKAGLWRLVASKAVRVKTADGADFIPAGQLFGGNYNVIRPADNGLLVPGPHNIKEGRESDMVAAWMVRQGVARPLLQADGSNVFYQRLSNNCFGEDNPMFCTLGDRVQWWLIKDEKAIAQEIPREAGDACIVVDGRPLLRAGESGTRFWILEQGTWKRLTDTAGAPLDVFTELHQSSPANGVSAVGSVLWVNNIAPGKVKHLLFNIKGSSAEPIRLPDGASASQLIRMGKTALVLAYQNNQLLVLSVNGGKVAALKGVPKGTASFSTRGEVSLARVPDTKGRSRYYRIDNKGNREINLPEAFENASYWDIVAASGKTAFCTGTIIKDDKVIRRYWRMDDKCSLTPINLETGGDSNANNYWSWLIAQDGAYAYNPNGDRDPRFLPAS